MQFYAINISQVIIIRLYTVYNKQGMRKIGNQTREKLQVLSHTFSDNFAAECKNYISIVICACKSVK